MTTDKNQCLKEFESINKNIETLNSRKQIYEDYLKSIGVFKNEIKQ